MSEPGKTCPTCGKQVAFWSIIRAPLPNMIRCEHCNSALVYEKNSWSLVFFSFLLYLVLVGGLCTTAYFNLDKLVIKQFVITWGIASILYWVLLEFTITAYLRSGEKLINKKPTKGCEKEQDTGQS